MRRRDWRLRVFIFEKELSGQLSDTFDRIVVPVQFIVCVGAELLAEILCERMDSRATNARHAGRHRANRQAAVQVEDFVSVPINVGHDALAAGAG
jgi:hypothetical protein